MVILVDSILCLLTAIANIFVYMRYISILFTSHKTSTHQIHTALGKNADFTRHREPISRKYI